MGAPDFVLALRAAVGTDLLLLPGVTAVVLDEAGRVLLARRSDTGLWALVSGILEPGEQPAAGLVREVEEETALVVRPVRLAGAWLMPEVVYPNGDRAEYLDLTFVCEVVSGVARVNDDESTDVGWFHPDALPEGMSEAAVHKLRRALAGGPGAWFEPADGSAAPDADVDRGPAAGEILDRLDDQGQVVVRRALASDVPAVVTLLADDTLGATRERDPHDPIYQRAFAEVDADPAQLLVVAEQDGEVVGTLQLTVLPGLSHAGARRAQVEAVRVAAHRRGDGLGSALLRWAADEARRRDCAVVQLTSNASRADARRFYERLGFVASHTGFKLPL